MSNYIGNAVVTGGVSTSVNSTASATPPSLPNVGDYWFDTDDSTLYVYVKVDATNTVWLDTSAAGGARPASTSGSTPPATPTIGDFFYDTDDGHLYQYIFDGTANVWLDVMQ